MAAGASITLRSPPAAVNRRDGICHLLGFRFAPRIKDLKDRKLGFSSFSSRK
jgi:TnpA family transposase